MSRAYEKLFAANRKKIVLEVAVADFLSRYLRGPLQYVESHITVNKMC